MATTTPVIRAARDGDAGGLIALIDACYGAYPDCILAVDEEAPELRAIASHAAGEGGGHWVAEDAEGGIIGSVGWRPVDRGRGVELLKLYVAPAMRRQGLGERLVAQVGSAAHRIGAAYLLLWTDARFTDAHRLYRRLGFTRQPGTRALLDLSNSFEHAYRLQLG